MASWKDFLNKFISPQSSDDSNKSESSNAQGLPVDSAMSERSSNLPSERNDYPNTYQTALTVEQEEAKTPKIFEPALKHFPKAFRLGDPAFQDDEISRGWHETRMRVIDYLLQLINHSAWKDHLVLRGSLLLKVWLGNTAREPGDIDWVFRPGDVGINDSLSVALFDSFPHMIREAPFLDDVVIEVNKIAVDNIWTYERADGKRIVFPWKTDGLPPGSVQLDVVFGEQLRTKPILTPIPVIDGDTLVWGASKEESLAWKLLWLETDMYPQGKDLYDATLLAEQTKLPLRLLKDVLQNNEWNSRATVPPDFPMKWEVDWENFKLEYPWVKGKAEDWQYRLTAALAQTFADDK